ncbi:hypothetical protein [Mycolicibacterium goodii]|uniref:hypothetical protein n=1 Tax=Mycolicibacterium goodii TaxID=134601 RepID=UPI001BDD1F45|nr:hypothetical protein [Mycolicibacterium goodii]MBU8834397.1 hypothetical protein [Mycolicibacterium goodii]
MQTYPLVRAISRPPEISWRAGGGRLRSGEWEFFLGCTVIADDDIELGAKTASGADSETDEKRVK